MTSGDEPRNSRPTAVSLEVCERRPTKSLPFETASWRRSSRTRTFKGFLGPFSLDDILHAWIEHDADTIARLPDPPGRTGSSISQRRNYWFYEGCQALEEGACMAEVGDGKFAIASLKVLDVADARLRALPPRLSERQLTHHRLA